MTRAVLILANDMIRAKAVAWVSKAEPLTRIEFKKPQRSAAQNAKMWACLTDIASQLTHHGQRLSTEDWKLLFMDALNREMRMVPNLDNNGFVNLGRSSSDLSVPEMSELIELIHVFGAQHGVVFHAFDRIAS